MRGEGKMARDDTLSVNGSFRLNEWLAADKLVNDFNAVPGFAAFGRKTAGAYVFAFQSTGTTTFGDGTTFWLNADLTRSTGLQVFGFAAGAEYAVTLNGGVATLTHYLAN